MIMHKTGVVACFGGEEFRVTLPATNEAGAKSRAVKMVRQTSSVAPCVAVRIGVSASIPCRGTLLLRMEAAAVARYDTNKAVNNQPGACSYLHIAGHYRHALISSHVVYHTARFACGLQHGLADQ
jgi:hypothetical protein